MTAELAGVPLDVAIQLLADMAGLKLVRVGNAYYVTTPTNADVMRKDEDRRRQVRENGDARPDPAAGKGASIAVPGSAEPVVKRASAERRGDDQADQTLLRPLLALTAVVPAPAPPNNDEDPPANRAMTLHLRMAERIDYELLVATTLDKALDELLSHQGIPWTVNERAFVSAGQDKDVLKKTEIDKIDELRQVPRRLILNLLLARIPAKNADGAALYVVRSDCMEITTRKAFLDEFYPRRDDAVPPPLVYALLPKKPLREALGDLAVTTGANVVLDPRVSDEALEKVTAGFAAVPLDTAVQVLADEAGLRLVRLGNVYYVTSPKNARQLRQEDEESRPLMPRATKAESTNPTPDP